jgi:hypothetical protein
MKSQKSIICPESLYYKNISPTFYGGKAGGRPTGIKN